MECMKEPTCVEIRFGKNLEKGKCTLQKTGCSSYEATNDYDIYDKTPLVTSDSNKGKRC